jgi:hypothetical protein
VKAKINAKIKGKIKGKNKEKILLRSATVWR